MNDHAVRQYARQLLLQIADEKAEKRGHKPVKQAAAEEDGKKSSMDDGDFGDYDARINEAVEVVIDNGMASTSLLQRKSKSLLMVQPFMQIS